MIDNLPAVVKLNWEQASLLGFVEKTLKFSSHVEHAAVRHRDIATTKDKSGIIVRREGFIAALMALDRPMRRRFEESWQSQR